MQNLLPALIHRFAYRLSQCVVVCVTIISLHNVSVRGEEITNSVGMTLRLLEAGRLEMGERDLAPGFHKDHSDFNTAGDESPVHPVVLTRPFYLATTEVTVGQFRQFVEETGYQTSAEKNELGAVGWDPNPPADNPNYLATFRDGREFNWKHPGFDQKDNHPVTSVSFTDAKAFCGWLSRKEGTVYRLPTEAEWEYAARAGTTSYFSFGDRYRDVIHRFANIGNVELEQAFPDRVRRQWLVDVETDPPDRHVFTAPVGSYEANPWGLHDLYGNVWEWCEDRYLDTAYTPFNRPAYQQIRKRAIDPLNLEKWNDTGDWRVIRGGSWFNAPIQCRSGVRGYFEAEDAACYLGFRVARDAPEEQVRTARRRFEQSEAARADIERMIQSGNLQERRDGRLMLLLRQSDLTDEFFAALEILDEPLDIHLYGEGRLKGSDMASIAKVSQLTGLLISQPGSEVGDDDFAMLENHRELELLEITGTSKLTYELLGYLHEHGLLEFLQLDSPGITDQGLQTFPELEHLETLHLRGTAVRGLALEGFRQSPLRTFSCSHLTDEGAHRLAQFSQLRTVEIGGSPISGRGLKEISQLPWVNRLILTDCRELSEEDFAVAGDMYDLRVLHLQGTAAGDAAVDGLKRLNQLNELQIGSENLTDSGLREICEIVSLDKLVLTKDSVNITDAGLDRLWRLVNLRSFSVASPRITGRGLATLPELPRIDWLQLSGPAIGDDALKYAADSKSLQSLFVGDRQRGGPEALTDAGLGHLARASSLKQFDLVRKETNVSDEALQQLRESLPQLKVNVR